MGLLLDSHIVLWLGDRSAQLGPGARRLITEQGPAFVSAITHVEFSIKSMIGKLGTPEDFGGVLRARGLEPLPFTEEHARTMERFRELVGHDPFDRMLLAQAYAERIDFLTADRTLLALDRDWIVDARA